MCRPSGRTICRWRPALKKRRVASAAGRAQYQQQGAAALDTLVETTLGGTAEKL